MDVLGACKKPPTGAGAGDAVIVASELGFPFDCESPFMFAVYHLDIYPPGDGEMAPAVSLAGRNLGMDFNNPSGWNMYHGETIPGFPQHPHRGFETITVTRRGLVDHCDSLGNGGRFGFGDVQWMTAGRGISHSEMFPLLNTKGNNVLEFFQVWINLPRRSKMAEPSFKMFWSEDLPRVTREDGTALVLVAGELPGFDTPPAPPPDSYASDPLADVLVVTIKLAAGASWTLPAYNGAGSTDGLNRNAYFYRGKALTVGSREVKGNKQLKLRPEQEVEFVASSGPAEILLLQGRDIGEPVVQHGPFVGNTREDIAKAFRDYQETGFGGWPWPSESPAHPKERPRFANFADGHTEERPLP